MSTNIDSLILAISNYPIVYPTNVPASLHELNELFQRLHNTPQGSLNDPSRFVFIKEIAHFVHSVYSHVLILTQQLNQQQESDTNYELLFNSVNESQQSLSKILRLSFNEDYRNAEISLGLVNAICQLLVLDVSVFGLKRDKMTQETKRLIGNTLTNLTFGNIKVKLKICSHEHFLETVTQLIDNKDELLQPYAALIRNLSWNSDNRMAHSLAKTVPALSRAAVIRLQDLHQDIFMRKDPHDENKSLLAILSALWNLASHSADNKKAICETQAFLYLLIVNLTNNPDKTLFVENATGILKYVSSYIVDKEHLLKIIHEAKIVKHLLSLLSSSSFTIILNSLGVFGTLVSKDQRTQLKLVQSEQARVILESLRNSNRDDVRNAVRIVLTHLNSSPLSGFAMTLPSTSRTARKEMRTSYDSNAMPHLMANQQLLPYRQVSQTILSPDGQPFFNQNIDPNRPTNAYSTFPYSRQNRTQFSQNNNKSNAFVLEDGLMDSQTGTCSGSQQSLTNVPTNWQSNITTNRNTGNHSPISPSNLPDSPTNFFLENEIDDESCILSEAIEAAMPQPRKVKSPPVNFLTKSDSIDDGTEILSHAIESVIPKPRRQRDHLNLKPKTQQLYDFQNPNETTLNKNNLLGQSALIINGTTTEKVRDASKLEETKSDHSEDNFCMSDMNDVVDSMLPVDIAFELQAEQMIIDCTKQSDQNDAQLKKTNRSARVPPFNYKKPVPKPTNLTEKPEKYAKSQTTKASITVANL